MARTDNNIDIIVRVDAKGAVSVLNSLGQEIKTVESASKSAEGGFSKFQARIVSLQSALSIGGTALRAVKAAAEGMANAIREGSAVDDITTSFKNLSTQAGVASDSLLKKFGDSLGNTIPKVEQMRLANELLVAGIDPTKFELLGKAARALAETTGGSAAQGFEKLSDSILRGNTRALKSIGIIVDETRAVEEFAAKHGQAADSVTDFGRVLAIREATMSAFIANQSKLGEVTDDAGDRLDQLSASFADGTNRMKEMIAASPELNAFVDSFSEALRNVPWDTFASGINAAIGYFDKFTANVAEAINGLKFGLTPDDLSWIDTPILKAGYAIDKTIADIYSSLERQSTTYKEKVAADIASTFDPSIIENVLNPATQSFNNMSVQVDAVSKSASKAGKELVGAFGRSGASSAAASIKKTADDTKRLEQEFNDFSNTIREMVMGSGPLAEFERLIAEAFANSDGEELVKQIEEIARAAEKAGISLGNMAAMARNATSGGAEYGPAGNQSDIDFQNTYAGMSPIGKGLQSILGTSTEGGLQDIMQFELVGANIATSIANGIESGMNSQDWKALASNIGGQIGGALGAEFGLIGSAIGSILGSQLIGGLFDIFGGKDSRGTAARKAVDKYFADLFEKNHITAVINGELQKIDDLNFGNGTKNFWVEGGPGWDLFEGLDGAAQSAFSGIGAGWEQILQEMGYDTEGMSGQMGAILANNLGGEISNLRVMMEAAGKTAEEMGEAILQAFLQGKMSALDMINAINAANGAFAYSGETIDKAWARIKEAGWSGGAALTDAIISIGYAAQALGIKTLPELANVMINTFGVAATQVQQFMAAMAAAGVNSLQQLMEASKITLATIAANMQSQEQGGLANISTPIISSNVSTGARSSTGGGRNAEASNQLSEMTRKLREFADAGVTNLAKIRKALLEVESAEKMLDAALERVAKGANISAADLTKLENNLAKAQKKLEAFGTSAKDAFLDKIKTSVGELNSVIGLLGGNLNTLKESAIDAFKFGKMGADEAWKAISGSQGSAIENYNKLKQYGLKGGQFSLDALRAIAESTKAAGGKTRDDMIRALLQGGATQNEVQSLIVAMNKLGMDSLDDLANASDEAGIHLLSMLNESGFKFNETTNEITKLLSELDKLTKGERKINVTLDVKGKYDSVATKKTAAAMNLGNYASSAGPGIRN